jgi:hypothetical protein
MGSVVNGLMGGGGGNILGAIGGIVGGIFGGPIGSMIGEAVGNMLQGAVGGAMNGAMDQLQREQGMPKFIADQVKQVVGEVLDGLKNGDVPAEDAGAAQENFGGAMQNFEQRLQQSIVDAVMDQLRGQGGDEAEGSGKGRGGKGSSGGAGGGWLQAIAKAMGGVLGDKAANMVKLSQEMSALNQKRTGKGDEADQKAAADFNEKMTQFQATSQEYNLLNSTFSTAIKALGEALSTMARKQ